MSLKAQEGRGEGLKMDVSTKDVFFLDGSLDLCHRSVDMEIFKRNKIIFLMARVKGRPLRSKELPFFNHFCKEFNEHGLSRKVQRILGKPIHFRGE